MELIQLIAILFALFAFSRVVLRFKDKAIMFNEFIFWSTVWIAVLIVAAHPATASLVSELVGVGRPVDLILYVSIILLFYLIFRLYVKIESNERSVTILTRELAKAKPK